MVFLCSCGGLIWDNKVHVCASRWCSCGGVKYEGRGHCCGYTPDYSRPPTDWELYMGYRCSDEWTGSPTWGKRSPSLFETKNQETRILNTSSSMEEIKNFRQTGSFQDYCSSFDFLLTKVIVSENYAISRFVEGLKPEIKWWVDWLRPKTLKEAYEKAKNYVNLLGILNKNKDLDVDGGIKEVLNEKDSGGRELGNEMENINENEINGNCNELTENEVVGDEVTIQESYANESMLVGNEPVEINKELLALNANSGSLKESVMSTEGVDNGQIVAKMISLEATISEHTKASVMAIDDESNSKVTESVFQLECLPLWGRKSVCGKRAEMEEASILVPQFMKIPIKMFVADHVVNPNLSDLTAHSFGTYDGHGTIGMQNGHYVSGVLAMSRFIGDKYLEPWIIAEQRIRAQVAASLKAFSTQMIYDTFD